LTDEELFSKALYQYRSAVIKLLEPLERYGQKVYVEGCYEPLVSLAVQLHYKLCGEGWEEPFDPGRPRVYPP
jgi:hypothetical protein